MAQGTREISLKTPQGTWGGLRDTSQILPSIAGATFESMLNVYHNRDGTELRRWLGSKEVGRPFLGMLRQVYQVEADTPSSGTARITVGHQWDQLTADNRYPHYGPESSAGTFNVLFVDSSVIPDGIYTATRVDRYRFTITVSASGSEAAQTGTGRVFIQRVNSVHVLTHAGGRPVVLAETSSQETGGTGDKRGVGAWVASRVMDPATVLEPGYPQDTQGAELAVDDGFISWPSPTVEPHYSDWADVVDQTPGENDIVWTMDIKRRMVADVLNRRIVVAVPGHACMFQVDVAREDVPIQMAANLSGSYGLGFNSDVGAYFANHRFMRALGIPRGVIKEVAAASGDNCMWAAVGYIDQITGEIGLASVAEEINLDSVGTTTVTVYTPRNTLAETYGLDILLYLSESSIGSQPQVLFPHTIDQLRDDEQRVLDAVIANFDSRATTDMTATALANIDEQITPRRFPTIEQMPTGAGWVRIVRSRMFSGGDDPRSVTLAVSTELAVTIESVDTDAILVWLGNNATVSQFGDLRCDGYVLPSSYEGSPVRLFDNVNTVSGQALGLDSRIYSMTLGTRIAEYLAAAESATDQADYCLFRVDRLLNSITGPGSTVYAYLDTRPDLIQISEENFPGITPQTNRLPIDLVDGEETTGVAKVGDVALVFTNRSTRIFQWGLLPRQATSNTLSSQYGCVAPASIVEGPGFATWLSDQGPMLYRGGLRWLGNAILDLWRTFVMESDGKMTNAQAMHDRERNLIIWQLATDHDNTTSDATKSKTTCNRLLVFNYAAETFTLVRRADSARPHCIATIPINDSAKSRFYWAPSFIAPVSESAYYPLHFMDERYNDRTDAADTFTANADRADNSDVFATASAVTGPGVGDDAFIRGPGGELRWWGRVLSISGNNITLDDSATEAPSTTDGAAWKSGDVLENQVIHMGPIKTNLLRAGDLGRKINIRGVNLRLELYQDPDQSYTAYAWARVRIIGEDGTVVNFNRNPWGDAVTDGTNRFRANYSKAEHFQVEVTVISNVQTRLQDIRVEVEPQA